MNESRSKEIRKAVYNDMSPRYRKYDIVEQKNGNKTIYADERRRSYQATKREVNG